MENKSPFELFSGKEKEKLLDVLKLASVSQDEVCLTPDLIKK